MDNTIEKSINKAASSGKIYFNFLPVVTGLLSVVVVIL